MEDETEIFKRCNECNEIYRKSKLTGFYQIMRCSGIAYVRNESSVMLCEMGGFFTFPGNVKMCLRGDYTYFINHYDEKAMEDVENNKCIMKYCDGKLEKFEGNIENVYAEMRDRLGLYYFGEGKEIINYNHFENEIIDDDLPTTKDVSCVSNF